MSRLNRLVAGIFASGSITTQNYVPSWAVADETERGLITEVLTDLNVDYEIVRGGIQAQATEVRPREDSSVLGRVLSALGAPNGEKANTELSLPDYLDDASTSMRESFARTYLQFRLIERPQKTVASLREERSDEYLRELTIFFNDVLNVNVTISEKNLYFSEWPSILT